MVWWLTSLTSYSLAGRCSNLSNQNLQHEQKTLNTQILKAKRNDNEMYTHMNIDLHTSSIFRVNHFKNTRWWYKAQRECGLRSRMVTVQVKTWKIPKTQGRVTLSSTGFVRFWSLYSCPITMLYDRK